MKSNFLLVFITLLLFGLIHSQLTFVNGYKKLGSAGVGGVTTKSNGIIINMNPSLDAGFVLSDSVIVTQVSRVFYVTLLACNTAADFGLQIGNPIAGDYYSCTNNVCNGAESLIGDGGNGGQQDILSLEYPGTITGTTTSNPYKPALNQVIKYKLTQDNSGYLFKVEITDYKTGAYLMNTPLSSSLYDVRTNFNFGFEVLNQGQAIFCVQTDLQVLAGAGDCDAGATTSNSLTVFTTTTKYSYSTPCDSNAPFFFKDACYQICPAGYNFQFSKACNAGCDADFPFSDKNYLCYTACPAQYPNRLNYECYDVCPVAAPFLDGNICYSTCPGGYFGYNRACLSACPAEAPNTYQRVCYGKCPLTARYNDNTVCGTSCPAGNDYYDENYICGTACPAASPNVLGFHCYSRCPTGNEYADGGVCKSACPAGSTYFDFYKKCYSDCSLVTPSAPNHDSTNRCYATCPITAPYLYNNFCDIKCPVGVAEYYDSNKVCYSSCPAGTPYYDSNKVCYATCPATAPFRYGSECLTSCPAGVAEYYDSNKVCCASCLAGVPLTPYFDSTKLCQATCPAASPKIYNTYDCRATCPVAAKFSSGNICVAACADPTPYSNNLICISACPDKRPYYDSITKICSYSIPAATPYVYNYGLYSACPAEAEYVFEKKCYVRCPSTSPYSYKKTCYVTCPSGKVCDEVRYYPIQAEESGLVGWKYRLAVGVPAIIGGALILGAIAKIVQIKRMQRMSQLLVKKVLPMSP